MKYFSKNKYSGNHQPDYVTSGVADIDYAFLKNNGIECVAFDIDGTLTRNGSESIGIELAKTIKKQLDKAGINKRFIASNSHRSLHAIAEALGAFEIHQPSGVKGKPSKVYYKELVDKSGFNTKQLVMIGDRVVQDIWGAKKAGLATVLVELNPDFATFRDKSIARPWWQPHFVRRKAKQN